VECRVLNNQGKNGGNKVTGDCRVDSFQVQQDFNVTGLQGDWYMISDIGLFPGHHTFDNLFYLAQDFKTRYILNPDGTVRIIAAGRMAGFCQEKETYAEHDDSGDLAKLQAYFPTSLFSSVREAQPYWIMTTDYQSALVYSCRDILPDGTCNPDHTYAWTINRHPEGHTPQQQADIDAKITELCLSHDAFISMPRDNPCPAIHTV